MLTLKKINKMFHKLDMLDPIYHDGFKSKSDTNPYEFPQELSDLRLRISVLPRPLTEEEKQTLKNMNLEFEKTEWARWSKGKGNRKRK